MIVVPITGISFRRVSGAVLEDCRRRVEQVEIKSAPLVRLNLLHTEERRVSECHGVVTLARQGERLARPPALASSSVAVWSAGELRSKSSEALVSKMACRKSNSLFQGLSPKTAEGV